MTAEKARNVYIESRYVLKDAHDEVLRVVGNLLRAGKQVAIAPWPSDVNSTTQTHWVISWPASHIIHRSAA